MSGGACKVILCQRQVLSEAQASEKFEEQLENLDIVLEPDERAVLIETNDKIVALLQHRNKMMMDIANSADTNAGGD